MDSMNRRVVILSFSPLNRDARVLRQIEWLSKHYHVTAVGYEAEALPGLCHTQTISLTRTTKGRLRERLRILELFGVTRAHREQQYERWYWSKRERHDALKAICANMPDIIHANDWHALPVAVIAANRTGAKIVIDLHEYAPLEAADKLYWRILFKPMIEYFLRRYLNNVSASITVGETIAEKYAQEYGLHPLVVMNAPQPICLPDFHPTNPNAIQLIHHGGALANRKLEWMIEMIARSDQRYTLNFMLTESTSGYIDRLHALAQRRAPGRVIFHATVTPIHIVEYIAQFDMGAHLLPASNFNNLAALPNKFFDFIAAGLAVLIGPSLEMARLTLDWRFGIVSPTFAPMDAARILNTLSAEEIDRMKLQAIAARGVLNAEIEMGKLLELYQELLRC